LEIKKLKSHSMPVETSRQERENVELSFLSRLMKNLRRGTFSHVNPKVIEDENNLTILTIDGSSKIVEHLPDSEG